jgi:hypothetical protein
MESLAIYQDLPKLISLFQSASFTRGFPAISPEITSEALIFSQAN